MSKQCFMHIDVNSAFLSWEAAYRLQQGETLDLREVPSVIGGSIASRHGIVLAKSIPAKELFNIKTGEPVAKALSKSGNNLVVVPPRHQLYKKASNSLMNVLKQYSPIVERFSIDEAFLNYSGMQLLYGDPIKMAHRIKDEIENDLGFTVNIGISTNKLLAKMACEFEKPNKVHTLWPHEIEKKMWPLPISDLYMVGRKTSEKLIRKGILTIGDLAASDAKLVKKWFKGNGEVIWSFANGIYEDSGKGGSAFFQGMMCNSEKHKTKGIGNSNTIAFDLDSTALSHQALLSLSETVSQRLREEGFSAKVLSIRYVTSDFNQFMKQHKFFSPTNSTQEIYLRACEVFDSIWDGQPIRQIGIHTTDLTCSNTTQTNMFEKEDLKKKFIDDTVDELREKYGHTTVIRGCFLDSKINPLLGGTWGNGSHKK